MALLDEPKGFRSLQALIQRENDAQKFAAIIERLNRLLYEHERMAAEVQDPGFD